MRVQGDRVARHEETENRTSEAKVAHTPACAAAGPLALLHTAGPWLASRMRRVPVGALCSRRKCVNYEECGKNQCERYLKKKMCSDCGWKDHDCYGRTCGTAGCGRDVSVLYVKARLCFGCGRSLGK